MIYEQRTLGADRVDTVRITLDTPPELIEQYAQDGYTEVMEHYLVLYKPRIPQDEALRLKAVVDELAKIDPATVLKSDLVSAITMLQGAIPNKQNAGLPIEITKTAAKPLPLGIEYTTRDAGEGYSG